MTRPGAGHRLRASALVAALLAPFVLAACRRGAPARTLRVAHESDVITLDPLGPPDSATNSILANFYEPLVSFDADMVLVPKLALSWETADPTTWLFRLRPGVTFQDGTPLTAHEVRTALLRAKEDPQSSVKGALLRVLEIREADPATVVLTTSRPDPLLLHRLTQVAIARVVGGRFVGTGPYRPGSWTKGRALEGEAFAGWWGGAPRSARVVFRTVASGPPVLEALRKREVDILRYVPENLVEEVRRIPGVQVASRAGLSSSYVWFDARPRAPRNPFADARVRRAFSLAVDRAAIVRTTLAGNALALDQAIPRGIFGHVASLPSLRYDLEEARRLLREAGYPDGFSATLTRPPGTTGENVAAAVREMAGRVGIRLALASPPWAQMIADWHAAKLPLFIATWRFDNGDAASFLQDCLVTRNEASGVGGFNPGFSSPELDRIVEESERVVEPAKRLALYEQAARILAAETPVVPLYHRYNLFAVSDELRWQPRLDGRILVSEIGAGRAP